MSRSAAPSQTLVYGMVGVPPKADPHDQVLPTDFLTRVTFDSLLVPDMESGGLQCRLAESYRPIDPTTWEFVLRPGITFGNGRPVTAEAVKWNFDRMHRNRNFAGAARLSTYEGADILDERTIRFRTRQPDMVWPRRAVQVVIADPLEADGAGDFGVSPPPGSGTGPYRIVAFEPDGFVRLEINPRSWRGLPKIAAMEMRFYTPDTLEAAFVSGEAHLGYLTEEATDRAVAAGLVMQRQAQANIHPIRYDTRVAPFDDWRFRKAMALAIDQQAIIDEAYRGHGVPANQVVGPDCFGFDPDLPPFATDPREARRLAAEVGYTGILKMDVLQASAVIRPWAEHAIRALNAVGIATEPNYVDMRTYLGMMTANDPPRSELIGAGNQYGPGLDADFGLDKFSNALPAHLRTYDNPAFQAVYDASQAEMDTDRRETLLKACSRIAMDDVAAIPIWQPSLAWLVSPRVKGLKMNSCGAGWADWLHVTLE